MSARPVIFVWPGDIHITKPEAENYAAAGKLMDEIATLIRPDFVQFAGDNTQHATDEQFHLFAALRRKLPCPSYALVGDHDVHHDPAGVGYRHHCGEPYGAFSVGGFRFVRLNTMEAKPLAIGRQQIHWFRFEVDSALDRGERVVLFQHHYPYQVWEDFAGPGIDEWREIVQTRRITAIFAGHTHYMQIANDGRNLHVASRSIGEPEGGAAGYSIVYLDGDDLAVKYRTLECQGPAVMITHPRDALTALTPKHIVKGNDVVRAKVFSLDKVPGVEARVDSGEWYALKDLGNGEYEGPLHAERLAKGEHMLDVRIAGAETAGDSIAFMMDRTGRFNPYPRVRPEVTKTAFC